MNLAPFAHLPRSVFSILRELARHALHHPVVGVLVAAHTADNRWVLIRRSDTGTWALPGGTLEWGETLRLALDRELREESGARLLELEQTVGIYSRPDRDPRFHAVTVVVRALVDASDLRAINPLEIREVRLFSADQIPYPLAHGGDDMLRDALNPAANFVLE